VVLFTRERVIGDFPCNAYHLCHRVIERSECLVERLAIGTESAFAVDCPDEAREIMPFDMDAVLALQAIGEIVEADLMVLGDDGAHAR
jgi:hypothetical protein